MTTGAGCRAIWQPLATADAGTTIEALLKTMTDAGLLVKMETKGGTGYRLHASLIQWRSDTGQFRAPDPICSNKVDSRVNPYFKHLYAETAQAQARLEARENTAQVEPAKRQQREEEFSDAKLPVCTARPPWNSVSTSRDSNVV